MVCLIIWARHIVVFTPRDEPVGVGIHDGIGNWRKFLAKIGQKFSPHLINSCYYQIHAFVKSTGFWSLSWQKFLTPSFRLMHFFANAFPTLCVLITFAGVPYLSLT